MKISVQKSWLNKALLLVAVIVFMALSAQAQTAKPADAKPAAKPAVTSPGAAVYLENFFKKYKPVEIQAGFIGFIHRKI